LTILAKAGDWSTFTDREAAIRAAAEALAAHPRCGSSLGAEACVVLADDALVQSLNRSYRGKDAPTNVLSFPFQEPPGADSGDDSDGDGNHGGFTTDPEPRELGMGFDHETDAQAEVMEGLEIEILASLGIADPYAASHATPEGR
jgi:probable rRNA maturation factor